MKIAYSIIITVFILLGYYAHAQSTAQKIGNNSTVKDASALLELENTNKGTLLTRVALSSTTDVTTISLPANGLTVFNTSTAGTAPSNVTPGYYFWSVASARWVRLLDELSGWSLNGNASTNPTNNYLGTSDNQDLVIKTNSQERIRVNAATRYVGIGNPNPNEKLEVNTGNIFLNSVAPQFIKWANAGLQVPTVTNISSGTKLQLWRPVNATGLADFAISMETDAIWQSVPSHTNAHSHKFYGRAAPLMVIKGDGNIGIGTTASAAKLDVGSGSVRVRDINLPASTSTNGTDRAVVADGSGNLKTVVPAIRTMNTAEGQLSLGDETALVNTTGTGNLLLILPAASSLKGKKYTIKKADSSTNYIHIANQIIHTV